MDTGRSLPCYLFLVVPDPMKIGDWVTWTSGTGAGRVKGMSNGIVDVEVTTTHPNKLSVSVFILPYPIEVLTVVPEAVAKIINS